MLSVLLFWILNISHSVATLHLHSCAHHARSLVALVGTTLLLYLILGVRPRPLASLASALGKLVIQYSHINLIGHYIILICVASDHHVCLLKSSLIHDDVVIIFLHHGNASILVLNVTHFVPFVALVMSIVLLGRHHLATHDLWVLYLNLRVIEYVVIVVDVFYYFDGLLVGLLFGLR